MRLKRVIYILVLIMVHLILVTLFVITYILILPISRLITLTRRVKKLKPRLLWGLTSVLNISYISKCLRDCRYRSKTHVTEVFHINVRTDFDYVRSDVLKVLVVGRLLYDVAPYFEFIPALLRFDIFHYDFNGGILYTTPLKFIEVELLHLSGKCVVMLAYCGDSYIYDRILSIPVRHAFLAKWPAFGRGYKKVERQVDYFSANADFVIAEPLAADGFPRWDILPLNYVIVDTDKWKSRDEILKHEKIKIFHAPNHRGVKGTEYFLKAVDRLISEGHPVELILAEGVTNEEVKK